MAEVGLTVLSDTCNSLLSAMLTYSFPYLNGQETGPASCTDGSTSYHTCTPYVTANTITSHFNKKPLQCDTTIKTLTWVPLCNSKSIIEFTNYNNNIQIITYILSTKKYKIPSKLMNPPPVI